MLVVVALVGCGSPHHEPQLVNVAHPHSACPAASDVWVASYGDDDGSHGWVLPLGSEMIEEVVESPIADAPMTDEQRTRWMPAKPPRWLMVPGRPPCQVTLGDAFVHTMTQGPRNRSFRIELTGCEAPADGESWSGLLVRADAAPAGCTLVQPYRVSEFRDWTSTPKRPFPTELASAIARPDTNEMMLWQVLAMDVRGQPAFWSIAINYLVIGQPGLECVWPTTIQQKMYVRGASGPHVFTFAQNDEAKRRGKAMSAWQFLSSGLVDDELGLRAVIVENRGEYQVYDLTAKPAAIAHHVRWYVSDEDAGDGNLGPNCTP